MFIKLFILLSFFFVSNFVKAEVLVNNAPWLHQFFDVTQYPDLGDYGFGLDELIINSYAVGQPWSETHAGPADCEASCAALGRHCFGDYKNLYWSTTTSAQDGTRTFLCSNEPYEDGDIFGVVWSIDEFQNENADPNFSPGKEACKSKNASFLWEYSGDNYYWGGIALCRICTLCELSGITKECKIPPPPPGGISSLPKWPSIDDDKGGNPGGGGGGGIPDIPDNPDEPDIPDDPDNPDEPDDPSDDPTVCEGSFGVEPEGFSCADNSIEDIKIRWSVTNTNNANIKCVASTSPALNSSWTGNKNLNGVYDLSIDLKDYFGGGINFSLDCTEDGRRVWRGYDYIEEVKKDYNDLVSFVEVTMPDDSPLNTDGLGGKTVATNVNVKWSCPTLDTDYTAVLSHNENIISSEGSGEIKNFVLENEGEHVFVLTCEDNSRCQNNDSETVVFSSVFPEPEITKFFVDPKILQGRSDLGTSVNWESKNTKYCKIDDNQYDGSNNSIRKTFPNDNMNNRTESINLTCYGYGGKSVSTSTSVILKYPPRITRFEAIPNKIKIGESTNFRYEVENANYCWIGSVDNSSYSSGDTGSGYFEVLQTFDSSVGTYTFVLTCKNDSEYEVTAETDVTVDGTACVWVRDESTKTPSDTECINHPGEDQYYGKKLVNEKDLSVPESCDIERNKKEDINTYAGKCPLLNCIWDSWLEPSYCTEPDENYSGEVVDEIKRCAVTNGPEGEKCEGGQIPEGCDEPTGKECISNE